MLYYRFKNPHQLTNVFFPVYWDVQSYRNNDTTSSRVIFPLWWSERSSMGFSRTFFPFVWERKDLESKSLTVSPFFSTRSSLLKRDKTLFIAPLFWRTVTDDSQSSVFFPLFWDLRAPGYRSLTLLPLFSSGRNATNTSSYLLAAPGFYFLRDPFARKFGLFPLFGARQAGDQRGFHVLLFLLRSSTGPSHSSFSLLWPLIERRRDTSAVSFRIAPLVWYKRTERFSYFSIQPFWYQYNSASERNRNFLWQLLVWKNELNVCKSTNFLWKTIFSDRYANGDHEFRVLYLLYANMKKDGDTEKSLFPIYHNLRKKSGDKSLSLLFYFYTRFSQKIPEVNDFYEEERIFWFLRLRSNYDRLKQEGKAKYLKRRR
jgi:hypothetical protein